MSSCCRVRAEFVQPNLANANLRAVATRAATTIVDSPETGEINSLVFGRETATRRSKRSSNGAEKRLRYRARAASSQLHAPGEPSPHGHGFAAATSKNSAGMTTLVLARAMRTIPCSSG